MDIHIFRSGQQPDVFGFTADATGSNLPANMMPWSPMAADHVLASSPASAEIPDTGASRAMLEGLERDGYYLARSETLSRNTGIPWVD